ncbi:MAG: NAD(P)-binding domain-containing protein [Bacteroidetes bacterium]|nr:NAD(P)-binding domain-containing protein [Bacteroidota bacterium]
MMSLEEIAVYGGGLLLSAIVLFAYLGIQSRKSKKIKKKIEVAIEEGVHEPVSLYPYIDPDICIGSGACVSACPEHDILGIVNGRGELISASNCVGHGACFHACPVEAISLKIGTEKRGVDLPHVSQSFETNSKGIFIAGELGGMGLIKNSVEQGKQAVDNIKPTIAGNHGADYDLLIVGAGPAGISASLQAKKYGLKTVTLDQDSVGGTVFSFPRAKVVMTNPMELPGYGKVKLYETSKTELLDLWTRVISENNILIKEHQKVSEVIPSADNFIVKTESGETYHTHKVLLAIGRRGSPRKLNVKGEGREKVAYRLLEPELISQKHILVVGGGDSAIESALLLAENNFVTLSYRGEVFNRLKPKNTAKIKEAIDSKVIRMEFNSNVNEIGEFEVILNREGKEIILQNDLVYIFAGGELPTQFLKNAGIEITKRFGYTMKSHHK